MADGCWTTRPRAGDPVPVSTRRPAPRRGRSSPLWLRSPRAEARDQRRSERRDLLRDGGLAVGGLVLVDDALRGRLVQLLHRDAERGGGLVLVAGGDGEPHVA